MKAVNILRLVRKASVHSITPLALAVGLSGLLFAQASNMQLAYAIRRPYVVNITSFGAKCDGVTNDKAALEAAISRAKSRWGGQVLVPAGSCLIRQTAASPRTVLPGNVTVKGVSSASKLILGSDSSSSYRELFRISGSSSVIQSLVLQRSSAVTGVMVAIERGSNVSLSSTTIDGNRETYAASYFHGISLIAPSGTTLSNLRLAAVTIKNVDYGLFQANATTGNVNGITVSNSTFAGNHADDLEFNSPNASMSNVVVSNSTFSNNKSTTSSSGFGVGAAHVGNLQILNNRFDDYQNTPVHIEDHSQNVQVNGNMFTNASERATNYASHIFIISGTTNVAIANNTFDTAGNSNSIDCVYVGRGGSSYRPSNVRLVSNTFKLRSTARALGVYDADGVLNSGPISVSIP